jgi:hypothetical protein
MVKLMLRNIALDFKERRERYLLRAFFVSWGEWMKQKKAIEKKEK